MKQRKRKLAWLLIFALCIPLIQVNAGKSEAAAIQKKGYTLSKKAGTYEEKVTVVLKAKKGYKVYYSTNGTLTAKKVLKSGKAKKFTFKKTKTLVVYAVKKSKKITKKEWKKIKNGNKGKKYKYIINVSGDENSTTDETSSASATATPTSTPQTSAATTATATPIVSDTPPAMTGEPGNNGTRPDGTPPAGDQSMGTPPSDNLSEGTSPADNSQGNSTGTNSTGDSDAAQKTLDSEDSTTAAPVTEERPAVIEETTAKISLSTNDRGETAVTTENLENTSEESVEVSAASTESSTEESVITIKKAGTYVLSGGTEESPIENTTIRIETKTSDAVNLVLEDLYIDNSAMGESESQDNPVIFATKKTTKVNITLAGQSVLKGNGSYASEPASGIIYAKDSDAVITLMASEQDEDASLEIVDSMAADTNFGTESPSDGIASKGTITIQSGVYKITSNGDGIKGKTAVNLTGGDVTIVSYGDGIQGEDVWIGGDTTKLNITTKFINAGKNYYSTKLGSGNYNKISTNGSTRTEVVNVDTGSHKGIKAGTKSCTYQYKTVEDGSSNTVGTTYTKEASGGLVITGGEITIDTTNTGIKYNGSGNSSGNSLTAANDGQYIIGAPDDTIHSNNTCVITGGTLNLKSADDGITSAAELQIKNNTVINITKAYEGMESGYIVIGKDSDFDDAPEITIYSDDDGVNAASKSSISYVYEDENELTYTKTETSADSNEFYMLDGSLKITISDDTTHKFSLPVAGQSTNTTGSYTGDGDGIDCNGSFYGYGGKVTVYGSTSGDNSPIDTDGTYYIGEGITLLALGSNGMLEDPTSLAQPVIEYGNSNGNSNFGGNMGNMGRMGNMNNGGSGSFGNGSSGGSAITANALLTVTDSSNSTILSLTSPKSFTYFLYSSPDLVEGSTYQLKVGGTTLSSLTAATSVTR